MKKTIKLFGYDVVIKQSDFQRGWFIGWVMGVVVTGVGAVIVMSLP